MSTQEVTTKKTNSTTYQKKIQRMDNTIPYRLVGTYEYSKALESFNRLLSLSKPDELEVYDRVLNERPEFTFFNGTNSAFQVKPDLKKAQPQEREKFYDQFQKKGLVWMMALARIELSATESLYGKSKFPFESTTPSVFESPAYLSILTDDATAHLKSLAQEAGFKETLKSGRKIDSWTLAYLRRLKLSRDMLSTLGRVGDDSTRRGIEKMDKKLSEYETALMLEVLVQTQPQTDFAQSTTTAERKRRTNLKISNSAIEDCEAIANGQKGGSGYGPGGPSSPGSSPTPGTDPSSPGSGPKLPRNKNSVSL